MKTVDAIVIGGGPGGYSAAIRLAQAGQQTLCVEKESVGGVCLNWGCIPSKALISVAQRHRWARTGHEFGIDVGPVRLDMSRAQAHNRSVVRHHTEGVASLIKTNGAELQMGSAKLLSPQRVEVTAADGTRTLVSARRAIVIATGARPRAIPGVAVDGERVLTAKEAVFLERVPEHLVVLGGGVIGLELGSAFQELGARLTVVELGPTLLPGTDPDLVAIVSKRLAHAGAKVLLETAAVAVESTAAGVRLQLRDPSGEQVVEASELLIAAGFVPRTEGLGLEAAGVQLTPDGHISTRDDCQTSVPGIYAIGDIAGPPYLAHKAFAEAQVVVEAVLGKRVRRDWRAMPSAIFTDPEIATVGLSEADAEARGLDVTVGRFPFSASGRAMARGETQGFVKLIADGDRLVGAGIVGPEASELVAELTLAIEVGATLEDLSLTIHPHPTLTEAVHDAAEHGRGTAVHVVNRRGARRQPARAKSSALVPLLQ